MGLLTPPSKNYVSPLITIPSRYFTDPPEGPKQVPLEFDWTTMGFQTPGTNIWAVSVNVQNNAVLNFSQICSIKVDNSACGSDVQFMFTDTGDVVTIAAGDPCSIVPVFSGATQFVAVALGAEPEDVTRAQLLNFVPYPVTVPPTVEQNNVTTSGLFTTSAATNIIPAGISGTLEQLLIGVNVPVGQAAAAQISVAIVDGGGSNFLLNSLGFAVAAGQVVPYTILFNPAQLNWRFVNGVKISFAPTAWSSPGLVNVFAAYKVP